MRKTAVFIAAAWVLFHGFGLLAGELERTGKADLNGDGKSENMRLKVEPSGKYVLTVGGVAMEGAFPPLSSFDEPTAGISVVDVDRQDKYKELQIRVSSSADSMLDARTVLYRYDGGSLREVLRLDGRYLELFGNGIVHVTRWRGFWMEREKYVWDRSAQKFREVPQAFYYVGVEGRVVKSFPIFRALSGSQVVAQLRPKSAFLILVWDRKSNRYLVRSESGLVGWARPEALESKTSLPSAG